MAAARKKPLKKTSVTRGTSGLKTTKKINLKLIAAVVILVGIVGGYFVYKSQVSAYTQQWKAGNSSVKHSGSISIKQKQNGFKFWQLDQIAMPPRDVPKDQVLTVERGRLVLAQPVVEKSRTASLPASTLGTYCVDIETGTRAITVAFEGQLYQTTANSAANQPVKKISYQVNAKKRAQVCTVAELSRAPLTVIFSDIQERIQPATKTIIWNIYKKDSTPVIEPPLPPDTDYRLPADQAQTEN